jgi:hypothetical protein
MTAPLPWYRDLGPELLNAVLDAAVGVEAIMASGYESRQAADMCVTAYRMPGTPVAFDTEGGGKAQVVYHKGLGWLVEGTS